MSSIKAAVSCVMFFFFSSRRRHTRLQGDWSSDVCSSDLLQAASLVAAGPAAAGLISTKVAALTEGVMKAMLITKLKIATAVLLAVAASEIGRGACRGRG